MMLGSLFDGIGGWLLAAKHAGVRPVWASEIEPFPRAVTASHFPEVRQMGDITQICAEGLPFVDIITAGSPCQDLSIAGRREGFKGARSGLFIRAIELVRGMRRLSGGRYPRYFVWENVPGAFSSNRGMDFRQVLSEITEADIPMPASGRWANAGVVRGRWCEVAWRVLDAQYFGVPQRRKRIFLVADFGGQSAGEVLFERAGVRGDIAAGGETRKGTAGSAESGIDGAIGVALKSGALTGNTACALTTKGRTAGATGPTVYIPDKARALTARNDGSPCIDRGPGIIAAGSLTPWDKDGMRIHSEGGVSITLRAHAPEPIFIAAGFKAGGGSKAGGIGYEVEKAATLSAEHSGTEPTVAVYGVGLEGRVAGTLDASYYKEPGNRSGKERGAICVFDMTHAVPTVFTQQSFSEYAETSNASAIKQRDYKYATDLVVGREIDAAEGNTILCLLRKTYGEKAVSEWCTAILARIQSTEVLRQGVHEESVSSEAAHGEKLDDGSLPRSEFIAEWLLRDLREREECGCTPQGRESAEQRHKKLNESMQELPYKTPSSAKEMCDMWRQAQGVWLLREALAAFQKIRESVNVKSGGPYKTIRRLTPVETERLQGLPDGYTDVPCNGKPASDTARYKALGNGMAQPCADFVIRRIVEVA